VSTSTATNGTTPVPAGAGASGSATDAPNGATVSYHGQPILKAPVWSWEIADYLFLGGLAGASATLAYASELRGADVLGRRAWLTATAAITACPPLLISDLGRPERFLNMLRMFKVTSPMSMGSWILAVSGAATTLAGVNALTGRLAPAARLARPMGALSGLMLSTYTSALFADTAVPAWHEAVRPCRLCSGPAPPSVRPGPQSRPRRWDRLPRHGDWRWARPGPSFWPPRSCSGAWVCIARLTARAERGRWAGLAGLA
jgi:hypothetical protein